MARRYGYAHKLIYNNEAYDVDGIEFTEFEDICNDLKIEEGEPFYYKALYDFLLSLGYDVEPPDPKFCPTKEELASTVPASTVSGDSRDKWTKEKILREKERLLNKQKKLLELEEKLRRKVKREKEERKKVNWDRETLNSSLSGAVYRGGRRLRDDTLSEYVTYQLLRVGAGLLALAIVYTVVTCTTLPLATPRTAEELRTAEEVRAEP